MFNETLIYGLILVICLFISVEFFVSTLKHKTLGYRLLSFNIFIYILLFLSEAFQIFTIDLHYRLFASAVSEMTYTIMPVIALSFSLYLLAGKKYIKSKYMNIFLIIPTVMTIGFFLNCFIPILYTITILPNGFSEFTYKPIYTSFLIYQYLIIGGSTVLLVIGMAKHRDSIKPYLLLFFAYLITSIGILFIDTSFIPLIYMFDLILVWWAISGYDLLDSTIIHQEFIDSTNIGMLFFNEENKLIEFNKFVETTSTINEKYIGQKVENILNNHQELLNFFYSNKYEIKYFFEPTKHWYKLNKSTVYRKDKLIGHLLICEDVTEDTIKNQELKVLNSVVKDVKRSTSLSIYYKDAGGKYHWFEEAYRILERDPRLNDINHNIFEEVTIDTRENIKDELDNLTANEFIMWEFTIKTENNTIKHLRSTARKIYDNNNNYLRLSMSAQDITTEKDYTNHLIKTDREKTVLLQEIHHRVKNNLQLIMSFINLEKRFHKGEYEKILDITERRITSLALIHERIYKDENMNYMNIAKFLADLDKQLINHSSINDIEFIRKLDDDLTFSINIVTPLSLIINELTVNTIKHAFDENTDNKTIYKSLNTFQKNHKIFCRFEYKDNGTGVENIEKILNSKGLGWQIINSLVNQMDGNYEITNKKGIGFILIFPIN